MAPMRKKRALYGTQTKLAIENFPVSGIRMPGELIAAIALIKEHAALVNGELGLIPKASAHAVADAARSISEGKHADQFPIDVFQTGSGTSTNMNVNEVIATLASNPRCRIHPNDDVNRCQSISRNQFGIFVFTGHKITYSRIMTSIATYGKCRTLFICSRPDLTEGTAIKTSRLMRM